jgi:hypothetical protein
VIGSSIKRGRISLFPLICLICCTQFPINSSIREFEAVMLLVGGSILVSTVSKSLGIHFHNSPLEFLAKASVFSSNLIGISITFLVAILSSHKLSKHSYSIWLFDQEVLWKYPCFLPHLEHHHIQIFCEKIINSWQKTITYQTSRNIQNLTEPNLQSY